MMDTFAACTLLSIVNYMPYYMYFEIKTYRWTSDYNAFNRLGYRVVHVCKACGSHVTVGCCPNYSSPNKSTSLTTWNPWSGRKMGEWARLP